jgi:hypothetical protein
LIIFLLSYEAKKFDWSWKTENFSKLIFEEFVVRSLQEWLA